MLNPGEGIAVGPFLFSPALELTWESRDNIFFTADDKVPDKVYLVRARLMFELPVYGSYVRFTYTPQARSFKEHDLLKNWSHFVDVSTGFELAGGLKLNAAYNFASANLETQLVDPGGELVVGGSQFDRHFVSLTCSYWVTERDGFTVLGDYTDIRYQELEGAGFPENSQLVGGAGWLHQVNPTAVMNVTYRRRQYDPRTDYYVTGSTADEVTVGINGQVTPLLSADVSLGYRNTSYDAAPGYPAADDYQGIVMSGHVSYQLAHDSSLRLAVLRSDYPSVTGNAFYTSTRADLSYAVGWQRLTGAARVGYQSNAYGQPDLATGLDREDKITTFGLGVGYRIHQLFSLKGSYLYEDRDSLGPYAYDTTVILLGLAFGF